MSAPPRRVRLRPWLVAQVSSCRFPGLQWIDPQRRLFQIPWKHATRHAAGSEEDGTIFKAWAVETGKFQEGVDEPDPAKWKANLRCALNKSREFTLKFDGTKETPMQPYKIYEVCEQPGSTDGAEEEEEEEEMPNLMDLTLNPPVGAPPFSSFPLNVFGPPMTSDLHDGGGFPDGPQDLNPAPPPAAPVPISMDTVSMGTVSMDPVSMGTVSMDTVCLGGVQSVNQPSEYDLLNSIPLTDLDLKFQYRGRKMGCVTVSDPQGCRLFSGLLEASAGPAALFGPPGLQQVPLPPADLLPPRQRAYTLALLDAADRGLLLLLLQHDIYAVRLCQCKVFWSGPGAPARGPPNPLERERRVKVFSLNDFLQGLISFQRGEADSPPPFEILFCFGEDWPDSKPKEKKLIIVQVVPVVARILTEMFSGELGWSTDSVRLQISNPDVNDRTVEQFKELQRLLSQQSQGGGGH